ncbi:MAG: prolipoprotein diacylglyceryl transferase, partial [Planctomycetales bacterium]|nr:prolipoprotein diacylglyceryl transferase [Planctomycetales bacterium]
ISDVRLGPLPLFGAVGWLSLLWLVFTVGLLLYLWRRQGWNAETRSYLPVLGIVWLAVAFVLPVLVEKGQGIPIRGYGVMLLLGVVAGVGLAAHQARRMAVDPEHVFSLAFAMFVAAIIGARVFFVIQYWHEFTTVLDEAGPRAATWPEVIGAVLNVTQGGLVVYGSLIGGLLGAAWYLRRAKLPMLAMGDLIAPSLVLGLALGRLGCLMNGCCFGGPCALPWGVTFPFNSPPYQDQVARHLRPPLGLKLAAADDASHAPIIGAIDPDGPLAEANLQTGRRIVSIDGVDVNSVVEARALLSLPRTKLVMQQEGAHPVSILLPRSLPAHPTQIYASINAGLLALLLWAVYPFRPRDGFVIALLLTLYPITRFLLEAVRTDEPGQFGSALTISQWVSVGMLLLVAVLWWVVARQPRQLAFEPKTAAGG